MSGIDLTFTTAMVTKMAENRKVTILEQVWDIWQQN